MDSELGDEEGEVEMSLQEKHDIEIVKRDKDAKT